MNRFVSVVAVLACVAGCSLPPAPPEPEKKAEASDEAEAAAKPGKFADTKLGDLEARAKKAGWKVLSASSDKLAGAEHMDLELDNGKHFAYVSVVDLGVEESGAKHAAKMGKGAGITVELESLDDKPLKADALLSQVLAKTDVDALSRDALAGALKQLSWKIESTESFSEDGVTWSTIIAEKGVESSLIVNLYEFKEAAKDGRLAIDGDRLMNVFVCKDCVDRKEGTFAEAWQKSRAEVLLGKLTNEG